MKRFLVIIAIILPQILFSQADPLGIFKYATVYTSGFASTPAPARTQYYINQMGEIKDITVENPYDYKVSLGIRKVARFDYENRQNRFYDGQTEHSLSTSATVGAVKGLEYLFQFDKGRQQGREYENERYFFRHMAKHWMVKGDYYNQGLVNLKYAQVDARLRAHVGNLDFSLGLAARQNKPYGYNPIEELLDTTAWFFFAYSRGFTDFMYGIDSDLNDSIDDYDWYWEDAEGREIASSDEDFRRHVFPDLMRRYNNMVLDSIGYLGSLSAIAGVDYYHYTDKFWIHTWGNLLFAHRHMVGEEHFSYKNYVDGNQWLDYTAGAVLGWKLGRNWGLFAEGEITKYWDKRVFGIRAGINYQFR